MKYQYLATAAVLAAALTLAACDDNKKNEGLHTGATLQDCPAIKPEQREEAARVIKDAATKDDAVRALVAKYGISEADAAACLK